MVIFPFTGIVLYYLESLRQMILPIKAPGTAQSLPGTSASYSPKSTISTKHCSDQKTWLRHLSKAPLHFYFFF